VTDFTRPPHASEHCRHYSYKRPFTLPDSGPCCALGIDLSAPGASFVCMPEKGKIAQACQRREEYTDAERAAWQAAVAASAQRLGKAVQALPRAIPLRSGGVIDCPNCDGKIRYDRWHRGAELRCSTPYCCAAHFSIAAGADWPSLGD
jgi:hypothetical protein